MSSHNLDQPPRAVHLAGDLFDTAWLADQFSQSDGAVHAATPGDASAADLDGRVVEAAQQAFAGTGRPYLHTSGVWVYGSNHAITERSPMDPPALVGWRVPIEQALLNSDVAATVIAPGIVHGRTGKGVPAVLADGPRDSDGALTMIGDGRQHWTAVHVDDLAELYVLVLERDSGSGRLLAVSGLNPTVQEVATAIAGRVRPESPEQSRERLGPDFADALLLDQQATGDHARSLGWTPSRPGLLAELRE